MERTHENITNRRRNFISYFTLECVSRKYTEYVYKSLCSIHCALFRARFSAVLKHTYCSRKTMTTSSSRGFAIQWSISNERRFVCVCMKRSLALSVRVRTFRLASCPTHCVSNALERQPRILSHIHHTLALLFIYSLTRWRSCDRFVVVIILLCAIACRLLGFVVADVWFDETCRGGRKCELIYV